MPKRGVSRVVSVAVVHGDRVLVVQRSPADSFPGYWELPGGAVEKGESFRAAAARELAEETGIPGGNLDEFHHVVRPPLLPGSVRYALVEECGFRLELAARPDVVLSPNEHSEYRWVGVEELTELPMAEPKRNLACLALRCPRDRHD